jgi:predicted NUDIX family phosphoesterase
MSTERATYLDIAEKFLSENQKPMSAREIVSLALQSGVLFTEGATPWQTMKSKLSTDILNRGSSSRFKRVSQGLFALRTFDENEFIAARFIKNKLDEEIAVIAGTDLRQLIPEPGYFHTGIDRNRISVLMRPMMRRAAEDDFSVVQLVSVFIVHHKGRFLTHLRSARLPEQRLRGEYSVMLGGHLAVDDFTQLTLGLFDEDSLADCSYILRELSEELILETDPYVVPCGYIYDVSREVSKQHLGLVYSVDLAEQKYQIGERGFLMNSRFETPDEIRSRIEQFENWSVVLLDHFDRIVPVRRAGGPS